MMGFRLAEPAVAHYRFRLTKATPLQSGDKTSSVAQLDLDELANEMAY